VAIYRAGDVFGRDTWAPFLSSSHYTLRDGPGRALHGHMDGGSLTLWARGRQVLVDSGHVGYEQTSYRARLVSL
jgi:hypothetical protein